MKTLQNYTRKGKINSPCFQIYLRTCINSPPNVQSVLTYPHKAWSVRKTKLLTLKVSNAVEPCGYQQLRPLESTSDYLSNKFVKLEFNSFNKPKQRSLLGYSENNGLSASAYKLNYIGGYYIRHLFGPHCVQERNMATHKFAFYLVRSGRMGRQRACYGEEELEQEKLKLIGLILSQRYIKLPQLNFIQQQTPFSLRCLPV